MLSYVHQVLRQKSYSDIETEEFDDAIDMFASILDKGVSVQLKRGLNRDYILNSEQLSVLRGKIILNDSIKLISQNRRSLICEYDDFSENILMNRILKTTLIQLLRCKDVKEETRQSIKKNLLFFSNIKTTEPSSIKWSMLRYNCNNANYRLLMNICYLIIEGLLLSQKSGKNKMATFSFEEKMHSIFESFVLEYYKKHYPMYRAQSKKIYWDTFGESGFLPLMKTDITLIDGPWKLIIDTKYYSKTMQNQFDAYTLRSNNLYQIYSYVKNEDCNSSGKVSGMLLYAKTKEDIVPNYSYNIGGNQISAKTLDLGVHFGLIKKQLNNIVESWIKSHEGFKDLQQYSGRQGG